MLPESKQEEQGGRTYPCVLQWQQKGEKPSIVLFFSEKDGIALVHPSVPVGSKPTWDGWIPASNIGWKPFKGKIEISVN